MAFTGQRFTTNNSTVSTLPAGSTLVVTGKGELMVTGIGGQAVVQQTVAPAKSFEIGDQVDHVKYGSGVVVRPSSYLTISGGVGDILVAFDEGVVRRVRKADLS